MTRRNGWLKRAWCRAFHNAFMNPRHGYCVCGKCQTAWEVDLA